MNEQRIRVTYRKASRLRFTSHLDVLRAWERALRRAGLPLAYSEGFTPHPRLAFAAPLPLGFAGDAEVFDATMAVRVVVSEFQQRLQYQTTADLAVVTTEEIPLGSPPPQAVMRWADYRVELPEVDPKEAASAVEAFLARARYDWTEDRHDKRRVYDLRATVAHLCAVPHTTRGTRLGMRLQSDQEFAGRPEQVVSALFGGGQITMYTRTSVILANRSAARDAWRRKGIYE